VTGVDLDAEACAFAARLDRRTAFVVAQGKQLPFPKGHFEAALCHFLLLWTPEPELILTEMTRVTAPGGPVLCLAEPDYGARIDFPTELAQLGAWQAESLAARGADVTIGRRLRGLCIAAGLQGVEAGILGAEWSESSGGEEEWPTLWNDLEGSIEPDRLMELRNLDARAWSLGNRILYVPTFYAWGRTPSTK
jgi:SAM-dependent methyltransferase